MTHTPARRILARCPVRATMSATLTLTAMLGASVAQAEPVPIPPSADQLTRQVSVIFDLNADRNQRASYLETGVGHGNGRAESPPGLD